MRRLMLAGLAVVAAFAVSTVWIDTDVSPATPWVVLLAGLTALVLAVTQTASTRRWTYRAVGLVLYLYGIAVLLLGSWWGYRWGLSDDSGEVLSDLVLALWAVGCVLALLGTLTYWLPGIAEDGD